MRGIFRGALSGCALTGPVLRDTARLSQRYPPLARYGFWVPQHTQLGAITPPPFSECFPRGDHAKRRCDTPPPQRGISAILARYPMKTRQLGAIPPLRYYLEKVLRDRGGDISHWAAKAVPFEVSRQMTPCRWSRRS